MIDVELEESPELERVEEEESEPLSDAHGILTVVEGMGRRKWGWGIPNGQEAEWSGDITFFDSSYDSRSTPRDPLPPTPFILFRPQTPMDVPLHPPVRIQTLATTPLSTKNAEKRLEAFIQDFQARSTASQGGNTAVTVQLQKLKDALHDERKRK